MSMRFFTETEVSERTQISLATLRRWRIQSKGPKFHKFGSLVRYAEEDLTAWQETRPTGGSDPLRVQSTLLRHRSQLRRSG